MRIRAGAGMTCGCPRTTPTSACPDLHFTCVRDLDGSDDLGFDPRVPMAGYHDSLGSGRTTRVAPGNTFGPDSLAPFRAWTDEVAGA